MSARTGRYAAARLLVQVAGGVALGLVVALSAVALHALWWGLLLGVAGGLAAVLALAPGVWRVAYAAGWVVVVALAAVPRPAGSYLIAGNLRGYTLLALTMALLVVAVATVPRTRR